MNGTDLWGMLQLGFNWLSTTGYTPINSTQPVKFPVLVGEISSTMLDDQVRQTPK